MRINPALWFTLFVVAVLALLLWTITDFPTAGARRFPGTFAIIALCLAALQLFLEWRNRYAEQEIAAVLDTPVDRITSSRVIAARALRIFGWVFGFAGLTLLFSLYVSLWAFVPAYLMVEAKARWQIALLTTVVLALVIFGILGHWVGISVPHGLFFRRYLG